MIHANSLSLIGNTPLVRLNKIGKGAPSPLLAKCEFLNPGGSVKDRIALAIIEDAEAKGQLKPGDTLIEATAGNTGMGLALVAANKGYQLVCVLPEKMSKDKRQALTILGAKIIVTPNAPLHDARNFRNVAKRLAVEHGWFHTDQFGHPANPRIHFETTGPEILKQCDGRVGAFVSGVGTGGTITGVGRYLKQYLPDVKIILADPIGSRLAYLSDPTQPDLDAAYLVEGIGGSEAPLNFDLSVVDGVERVRDEESFAMTARLLREEGLLVGSSTGTNVAAALRVAQRKGINGPVVSLLCDSWDRYFAQPWMQRLGGTGAAQ
ncbi:MAG TPA: cysteine synthase family protein [Gemmatales bacterium]|nr:cysteine synthase family protein [Gemmatales bacterium]